MRIIARDSWIGFYGLLLGYKRTFSRLNIHLSLTDLYMTQACRAVSCRSPRNATENLNHHTSEAEPYRVW